MKIEQRIAEATNPLLLELERVRTELATGLQEFHQGTRLQGARYVGVGAGGRTMAWGGQGRLVGWSLRATGGSVTVVLRDSRTDSGDILAMVELAAEASETIWLGPGGVSFVEGLYVEALSDDGGVLQGAVWLGAVD